MSGQRLGDVNMLKTDTTLHRTLLRMREMSSTQDRMAFVIGMHTTLGIVSH